MSHYLTLPTLTLSVMPLLFLSSLAHGQMGNAPFTFKNSPDGGVGMSVGGREAITNDKLYNMRPENLLRGPDGTLLNVQKGPGGIAIVSYPNGQIIPQYRGTDFRGGHQEMAAGVFNGYFLPSMSGYNPYWKMHSGATVSTWTSRITSDGMPLSYMEGNVVDMWTGQVLIMDARY